MPPQQSARFDIFEPAGPRSGPPTRTSLVQKFLVLGTAAIFVLTAACLHIQQWLGAPLYFLNIRWHFKWQAIVKQSAALLVLGLNQLCAPTTVRIGGDASVAGQIRADKGGLDFAFADRAIVIANHQIYTDWIFFWWTAYIAGKHGSLFVVLKDALKKIPVLGSGMQFFSWIFLSRRWEVDRENLEGGVKCLAEIGRFDSMWLLLFPEGTNMSRNARAASQRWAGKSGIADLKHVLLPRSRGLQCCLQGLSGTVDWVYDCTIAYDGIPAGEYGQEVHSLRKLYVEGRPAPQAHMYWRRFATKDIPYRDVESLDEWILQRWIEKDELLEHFQHHGSFPVGAGVTIAKAEIRHWRELTQICGAVAAVGAVWMIGVLMYGYLVGIMHLAR